MGLIYLGLLLISIAGQVLLDRRYKLTFWRDGRRAAWTAGIGIAFFLTWDMSGIGLRIFYRGVTEIMGACSRKTERRRPSAPR